jgi:hypothetical protein
MPYPGGRQDYKLQYFYSSGRQSICRHGDGGHSIATTMQVTFHLRLHLHTLQRILHLQHNYTFNITTPFQSSLHTRANCTSQPRTSPASPPLHSTPICTYTPGQIVPPKHAHPQHHHPSTAHQFVPTHQGKLYLQSTYIPSITTPPRHTNLYLHTRANCTSKARTSPASPPLHSTPICTYTPGQIVPPSHAHPQHRHPSTAASKCPSLLSL